MRFLTSLGTLFLLLFVGFAGILGDGLRAMCGLRDDKSGGARAAPADAFTVRG